jgi:predicted DNA-binding transcriptional regulator AlpA
MRLIAFDQLESRGVPYTRDHLRRLCKADLFPRPVPLSNRRIAFVADEVDAWVSAKIKARDTGSAE